jgi:hypothetical protein
MGVHLLGADCPVGARDAVREAAQLQWWTAVALVELSFSEWAVKDSNLRPWD